MDLQVAKLRVTNPASFDEVATVLGDQLSDWPSRSIPPGDHCVEFAFAAGMYALAGTATVVRGQYSVELRAGQVLRATPGKVRFVVREQLEVRIKTPDQARLDEDCRRILARMSAGPSSGTHGRFVPVVRLVDWHMDQVDIAGVFIGAEVGPLATALFAIPAEWLRAHPVNAEALSRCRFDCAVVFQPTCGTWLWPSEDRVPSTVLRVLRATGRDELRLDERSVGYAGDRTLYDVGWTLLADATGCLSSREELFVFAAGAVHRWIPGASGVPLAEAVAALLSSPVAPAATSAPRLPHAERVLDQLLSELWSRDVPSWMDRYMEHPTEVPYPVPFLAIDPGFELSPQFQAKWHVTQIRTGPEGALPVSHYASQGLPVVTARMTAHDESTGSSEWMIRWSLYHEFAEWRFAVVSDGTADLVVERELLGQWD